MLRRIRKRLSRPKATSARAWTIVIETTPGYGDEGKAAWIAEVLEKALGDRDPHVGLDSGGSVVVALDICAESFHQAVDLAVQGVVTAVRDAGGEFPVDLARVPQPRPVSPT